MTFQFALMLKNIFEEDGKWIALMTWAAACHRLKPRDLEIGWNRAMCAKRLKLIANNRRFTIFNEKGARPNLGSQLLGMAMRELPSIWKAKWGYSPLLAETFCDIERAAGTCYRAAGWKAVGKTRGFSRVGHSRDFFVKNDSPKVLYRRRRRPKKARTGQPSKNTMPPIRQPYIGAWQALTMMIQLLSSTAGAVGDWGFPNKFTNGVRNEIIEECAGCDGGRLRSSGHGWRCQLLVW